MSTKDTESNTAWWDRVSRPPREALKEIRGGRLKGMTDVNPQWRYRAMTELFGPVGVGWKYQIDKLWSESVENGEIGAFAQVSLFVKKGDGWSDPIPGIGGSMLMARESAGLRYSDEAYKMATTDALSVAMKALGVAADIYAGLWDGSKYREISKPGAITGEPVAPSDVAKLEADILAVLSEDREESDTRATLKQMIADASNDVLMELWPRLAKQKFRDTNKSVKSVVDGYVKR